MSSPHLGLLCGIAFGLLSVALMIPLKFPNKTAAMSAAFINRFGIGLVMGLIERGRIGWATGLVIGLLLSLPDAIVTKAYAPILVIGTLGGAVIGWVLSRFGV